MNFSNIEHLLIAILLQGILFAFFGKRLFNIWSCGAIAVAIFLGREISQNEYWWATRYAHWHYGQPLNIPWYAGMISSHWHLDSLMDVAFPLAGCLAVGTIMSLWKGHK